MINVSKIKKGIVLDHIEAGKGKVIYSALKLDQVEDPVVIMQSIPSTAMGKKDLIKIETDFDIDYTVLGLIAPNTTVNFVEGGERIKKIRLELPSEVEGIMHCKNPRCISNVEKVTGHKFTLANPKTQEYRCEYCDSLTQYDK